MCLLNEKRIKKITEKTAEKGAQELPFEVVFFLYGDGGEEVEGLSQNGKAAEGNQKGNGGQAQTQGLGGEAQQIGAVCHFQKTAATSLKEIGRKGQEKEYLCRQRKERGLLHCFRKRAKQDQIAADEEECIHTIGNGRGKDFC